MWHYLRDPNFSRFDTIPECIRHTDRHTTTAYTALSIASRGKNCLDEYYDILDSVTERLLHVYDRPHEKYKSSGVGSAR